jgi:hypothetical protein
MRSIEFRIWEMKVVTGYLLFLFSFRAETGDVKIDLHCGVRMGRQRRGPGSLGCSRCRGLA